MGMFKKKQDPIQQKELEIQKQISAIQQEIQRLSRNQGGDSPHHLENSNNIPRFGERPPRLRSTTRPNGAKAHAMPEPAMEVPVESADPIFEEVHQKNPFRHQAPPNDRELDQAMGLRQDDLVSAWERIRNHFRSPVTSNPKLVNYLAAGSIQGLRPLRYEKRIARNRFIALASILVVILWGILALLIKR